MAYTLTFGKYKGQSIEEVYKFDADYIGWLADKSYIEVARRAAKAVIAAGAVKDDEADNQLLVALKQIARSKPHPYLKKYGHVNTQLHRDYACIEFCTHAIHSGHGFSDMFFSEDWDIIQIATSYDDGGDYDEDDEYDVQPRHRTYKAGPTPTADAPIWHALADNSGLHPLNEKPVSLAEAVEILESHLAKK